MTNEQLIESIRALLAMDEAGALVPHGIGTLARDLFVQVVERLPTEEPTYYKNQRKDGGWTKGMSLLDCKAVAVAVPYQRVAVPFHESEVMR